LLRAYGQVAGKSEDWADSIISVWATVLDKTDSDDGGELEDTLMWLLTSGKYSDVETHRGFQHNGSSGILYLTEATPLLNALRGANSAMALPTTPQGLTQRIRGTRLTRCRFLDERSSPEAPLLRRTAAKRPIGFFVADDEVTVPDEAVYSTVST